MATKKSKKSKKQSTLYYFYSTGCAFCKQIDPIVEKLNKDGYDILRLNVVEPQNLGLANELRTEYKSECKGTPYIVNAETGIEICGWYDDMEELIKKWADGEKMDLPPAVSPKPKSPPPKFPESDPSEENLKKWGEEYEKWKDENSHLPGLETTEEILKRFEKWKAEQEAQNKQNNANKEWLESRLSTLEKKLDTLMNHLGVKSE